MSFWFWSDRRVDDERKGIKAEWRQGGRFFMCEDGYWLYRGHVGTKYRCSRTLEGEIWCESNTGFNVDYSFFDKDLDLCALFVETYFMGKKMKGVTNVEQK